MWTADVVAIVGSPRPKGNTAVLVDAVLGELQQRGLTCEKVPLGRFRIGHCQGHDDCGELAECPVRDDAQAIVKKAYSARGLLLASPVYSDNVSGLMKVFMDRCCHNYNGRIRLAASAIGLLCVAESTGLDDTIDCLRRFVRAQSPEAIPEFSLTGYAAKLGDAVNAQELMNGTKRLGRELADVLVP
jgi:multimeric flavodoxin WrbA